MSKKKPKELGIGTILRHSIGFGCDSFYQVIYRTAKTVTVRSIESKYVKYSVKHQSGDAVPIPNKFDSEETKVLRIAEDGQIGPTKRLIWWAIWEGKPLNQYSP